MILHAGVVRPFTSQEMRRGGKSGGAKADFFLLEVCFSRFCGFGFPAIYLVCEMCMENVLS